MTEKLFCRILRSAHICEIEIGTRLLTSQIPFFRSLASKFAIITDDQTAPLYGEEIKTILQDSGLEAHLFSFPHGEKNKTRNTKEQIENQLFEKKLGSDIGIIAIGGGVVSDLVGYIAATFCRGVPLVIIPTTLLGMVDASIGGKNGVNTPYGKNLIGSLYFPKKVIIDLCTLKTLSKRELANGMVETIKHALISDASFFEELEKNSQAILELESAILEKTVFTSCRIKSEIVEQDEIEKGKRHLLNFGHTVGHALELLSGFSLAHGEAVAIGLIVESYLSMELGYLDPVSLDRIKNIFTLYGLPLYLPAKLSVPDILAAMTLDKKTVGGVPRFVTLKGIGLPMPHDARYCTPVEQPLIEKALQWMLHDLHRH